MGKIIEGFIQENVAPKDYEEQLVDIFYGKTELFPSLLVFGMTEESAAEFVLKSIENTCLRETMVFHIRKMAYSKLVQLKRFNPDVVYGFFPNQCQGDVGFMSDDTYIYLGNEWVNVTNSKQK